MATKPASISSVAFVTPYSWDDAHPVNDYLRQVIAGIEKAASDISVVVIAPSTNLGARRATRRALRSLAHGASAAEAFASPALRRSGDVTLLTTAMPTGFGSSSIASRSALRLLLDTAAFDLLVVSDPISSDLARQALRRWQGLSLAIFHTLPPTALLASMPQPMRKRLFEGIDLAAAPRGATFAAISKAVAELLDIQTDDVAALPILAPLSAKADEPTDTGRAATDTNPVVLGRGAGDDALVRRTLREIASGEITRFETAEVILLARWRAYHRPQAPRGMRGRLHSVQARTMQQARDALHGAQLFIAFPGTPARAVMEAQASNLPIVRVSLDQSLPEALAHAAEPAAKDAPLSGAAESEQDLANELLGVIHPLVAKRGTSDTHDNAYQRANSNVQRPCLIDLHMHTDHSWDCATTPRDLLAAAKRVGLTAIAVTDHNEISGALACAELASEFGVQVIVGEEVMTEEGEVIGLFLNERVERDMGWHDTIAEIHRQGGLAYVPHPFDRMHTIPSIRTLRASVDEIDALETDNGRLAMEQYNRDAARFAHKYDLVAGAGSDAHVVQSLGTAYVRMPAWDDPESFLTALRQGVIERSPKPYLYVQGLKLIDTVTGKTKRPPTPASPR